MNSSYKIALLVAAGLCVLVVAFYAMRPATENGGGALTDATDAGPGVVDQPTAPVQPPAQPPTPTPDRDRPPAMQPPPPADATAQSNHLDELRRRLDAARVTRDEPTTAANQPGTTTPDAPTPDPTVGANVPVQTDPLTPDSDPPATADIPTITLGQPNDLPRVSPDPPATPREQPRTQPDRPTPPTTTPPAQPQPTTPRTYTIQAGDTFEGIAIRLYNDHRKWIDIAQANPLVDPQRLRVGQEIRLPDVSESRDAGPTRPRSADDPPGTVRYTVRAGDTLSSIAQQYYGSPNQWRVIYDANRDVIGPNPDRVRGGSVLIIPPAPRGAN